MLIGILMLFMIGTSLQAFAYDAQLKLYRDVPEKDWAAESIYRLVALGVVSGYEDGTYRPSAELTREAFVKLLVESVNPVIEKEKTSALSDVAKDRWSYGSIKLAYDAGWLDLLVKDGKFNPSQSIKREEVAALTAFALLQGKTAEEKKQWLEVDWLPAREQAAFGDVEKIDQKLAPYVLRTYSDAIMKGDDKGLFLPKKSLTRREAASIIDRMIGFRNDGRELDISAFYAASGPYKKHERFASADEIIFDWAKLDYQGAGKASVALTPPADWQQAITAAENSQSTKTLMIFANTTFQKLGDFVMDAEARQAFAVSVGEAVANASYGFERVAIDFEGLVPASYKEPLNELLRAIKAELGEAELTVVVPPSYYYAGYDYKQIGELADRVVLMAYEFTHEESGLPSAPLTLVGDAARDALKYIPADKLLLGISKQANQWTTGADGKVEFFRSPAIAAVESRIAEPGTTSVMQLPYFLNKVTFTDTRGSHLMWYENAQSIQAKMRLAKELGLRGVALWQINQLTDEDWTMISSFNK
ncbi:S-layer homology domain-containing protein [Paenibacillus sp. PL91]|uniref:S-layer homology domain-containing protein n=1 Tax=Paenibacillus sp. PL91 TaxID=2729538 RepID=UPI00145E815F|nr:S-layer homology domain-containing protein [Paenibacillus sp. PL91]MBC9202711.1 S-layer homology domain-containing protein [Paenibacillus sp. PL91]